MSGEELCVGICMIDWDAGVCLGCGRTTAEIHGTGEEPEGLPEGGPADVRQADEAPAAADGAGQAGTKEE